MTWWEYEAEGTHTLRVPRFTGLPAPPRCIAPLSTLLAGARRGDARVASAAERGAWFIVVSLKKRMKLISYSKKTRKKEEKTYCCPNDYERRLGHAFVDTGGIVGVVDVVSADCCSFPSRHSINQ